MIVRKYILVCRRSRSKSVNQLKPKFNELSRKLKRNTPLTQPPKYVI